MTVYKSVIEMNDRSEYHTAVIVFLRKRFGKTAAKSAAGYGYRQYGAVLCTAPTSKILPLLDGTKWGNLVNVKSCRITD